MKRLLFAGTIILAALAAGLVYERLFVAKTFGPAAMLSIVVALGAVGATGLSWALYDTRHRSTVANAWLALASTAVTYVVLDLAIGFVLIQPLSPALVPSDYRHHALVPNSYSRLSQRDFTYVQRTNNLGFRGRDVVTEKPSGRYRIAMLGDSFTMGKGVSDDETFSVLLERMLNARLAACRHPLFNTIEIVNGGIDSYAPVLSYLELRRDLAPLQPDMVVLNFDVSDLAQETAYRLQAVYGRDGEVVAVPVVARPESFTERLSAWIERRMFFTRALLYYTNELFGYRDVSARDVITQANYEIVGHTLADDTNPRESEWRHVFDSLERIKAFADAKGMTFLLSLYPWAHQVNDREWVPGRYVFMKEGAVPSDRSAERLRGFAREQGIRVLDAFAAFRQHSGPEPLFFKHDMHWTVAGNQVMAQSLDRQLWQAYLTAWCGAAGADGQ